MTHESELDFGEKVVLRLEEMYGEEAIETQYTLPDTGRRVDVYVDTPGNVPPMAMEVENDFESVFNGIGQAWLYSQQLAAMPFVVVPTGHVELPELLYLAGSPVTIVQFPVDG